MKILSICLNPTFQLTLSFNSLLLGEVNRAQDYREDVSGKGINVTRVLTQLGADCTHLTHLGGSRLDDFLALCKKDNLKIVYEKTSSIIRTCITSLDNNKKITTEFVQEPQSINIETEDKMRTLYSSLISSFDIIIFSGTKTPGYSKTLYPSWVKEAKEKNKIVILDIKGEDLLNSLKYKPDYIKPNLTELFQTFNPKIKLLEGKENLEYKKDVLSICKDLYDKYKTTTIITRGSFDTWYYHEGEIKSIKNKEIEVVNTIGCGDSFTAGFAYGILNNLSLKESLEKAVEIASLNASLFKPGTIY